MSHQQHQQDTERDWWPGQQTLEKTVSYENPLLARTSSGEYAQVYQADADDSGLFSGCSGGSGLSDQHIYVDDEANHLTKYGQQQKRMKRVCQAMLLLVLGLLLAGGSWAALGAAKRPDALAPQPLAAPAAATGTPAEAALAAPAPQPEAAETRCCCGAAAAAGALAAVVGGGVGGWWYLSSAAEEKPAENRGAVMTDGAVAVTGDDGVPDENTLTDVVAGDEDEAPAEDEGVDEVETNYSPEAVDEDEAADATGSPSGAEEREEPVAEDPEQRGAPEKKRGVFRRAAMNALRKNTCCQGAGLGMLSLLYLGIFGGFSNDSPVATFWYGWNIPMGLVARGADISGYPVSDTPMWLRLLRSGTHPDLRFLGVGAAAIILIWNVLLVFMVKSLYARRKAAVA